MRVTEVPAREVRPLIAELQADLLALLGPHQYRPAAPPGTAVQLDFGGGGRWRLTRAAEGWVLDEGTAQHPAAALRMRAHLAWRQLTGLPVPAGDYVTEGDDRLAAPLLAVRGILV
jgi:hypothetical protein